MSQVLAGLILAGLKSASPPPQDPASAAIITAGQTATANAIANAVSAYLETVTVAPGQTVATSGGPGSTTSPGKLIVPK